MTDTKEGYGLKLPTVKERILLHLFDYRRFEEDYEAPPEATQEGIAQAVGIKAPHFTQNARPLLSEEMLQERTSHIRRGKRRRKVYFLTERGRNHAVSLRSALLRGDVPFRSQNGEIQEIPLTDILQDHRRGTRLPELLLELKSFGYVLEETDEEGPGIVDHLREAPRAEHFVGRDKEVRFVLEAVKRAPFVVVTGMAGIGKSALGSKVCEALRGRRSLFWRELRDWDGATDLLVQLTRFLKSLGRVGLHNALLGSGPKGLGDLEEVLQKDLANVEALLVFDDVHKAVEDVSSFLALLLRVLRSQAGVSVLLLSRDAPRFYSRRDVELEGSVIELSLRGLAEEASRAILVEAGVAAPLIAPLIRATGGNPLFLRLLSSTGRSADPRGKTLEVYIAEEIEPGLKEPEGRCLEVASVYQIPVPAAGLLLEREVRSSTLVGLGKMGLLERVEPDLFVLHDTLRSYFGGGISKERLEDIAGKAVPWLREAAQDLAERGNPEDGIGYIQNAVAIDAESDRLVSSLEILGRLRRFVGDYPGAAEAYRAALRRTTEREVQARLHRKIALCQVSQGDYEEAEREIDAGLALLGPEPSLEAAWLYQQRAGVAYYRQVFDRCLAIVEQVLPWLPNLPAAPDLKGFLLNLRALVYIDDPHRHDPTLARADLRDALKAFEAVRDSRGLALVYNNLGITALELKHNEEAFAYLEKAESVAKSAGNYPAQATSLMTKAFALMDVMGDYEAAEAAFQRSYKFHKETHQRTKMIWHHWYFSEVYRRQGRYQEARESMEYFLRVSGDVTNRESRVRDLGRMVRLCVLCGDTEAGEAYFKELWEIVEETESEEAECVVQWAKATLMASAGDTERAVQAYRRASEVTEPHQRGETLLEYGRFLKSSGNVTEAREALTQASENLGSESSALGRSALAELESLDLVA